MTSETPIAAAVSKRAAGDPRFRSFVEQQRLDTIEERASRLLGIVDNRDKYDEEFDLIVKDFGRHRILAAVMRLVERRDEWAKAAKATCENLDLQREQARVHERDAVIADLVRMLGRVRVHAPIVNGDAVRDLCAETIARIEKWRAGLPTGPNASFAEATPNPAPDNTVLVGAKMLAGLARAACSLETYRQRTDSKVEERRVAVALTLLEHIEKAVRSHNHVEARSWADTFRTLGDAAGSSLSALASGTAR